MTIREQIKAAGLHQWEVAEEMHIVESTLIRWMRDRYTAEHEAQILQAIEKLKKKKGEQ